MNSKKLCLLLLLTGILTASSDILKDKERYLDTLTPEGSAMVFIPGGSYFTGDNGSFDNSPPVKRTFRPFHIDVHPVTNAQFLEFIRRTGYSPLGNFNPEQAAARPRYPVTGVTRKDAEEYAGFLGKRLPTEWEWEVAARALEEDFSGILGKMHREREGIFFQMERMDISPVFSTPPNGIGLYDHIGNIFEWTSGDYPEEFLMGRHRKGAVIGIIRGGAWTNIRNDVTYATRTPFPADRSLGWLGFRCVKDSEI